MLEGKVEVPEEHVCVREDDTNNKHGNEYAGILSKAHLLLKVDCMFYYPI